MPIEGKHFSPSLSTTVFEKIRDDILNNRYKNGEKIIEAKIATELSVSRTPVREALKQLELEGLIECIPNRGMIVKGISYQDVEDIYIIREVLENLAIQWAIARMPDEHLKRLEEIHDLMEFYAFKNDDSRFLELSTQFHEVIYSGTQSRFLQQILTDYQFYVKLSRGVSIKSSGRMKEALEEYGKILSCLQNKDEVCACNAMTQHIKNVRHH
ncbi:MAG: GntR family transcriptional regulator [Clostridia bacterium]|nr:GntR family transcriptional regulator [Clostridia bacterium]